MSGYGNGGLSSLDYWRLADELSVIDAAILITGNDPSEKEDVRDESGFIIGQQQRRDYDGYEAVFKALRLAVLSDKLRATVSCRARDAFDVDCSYSVMGEVIPRRREVDANFDEVSVPFDTLIRMSDFKVSVFSNRELKALHNATTLYVLKEPAWDETTVTVDDLKLWLSSKGLAPAFFFPQGRPEGFRDEANPRYSPKLACAVAAWEAVRKQKPNLSVKGTIEEWARANAVRFGMVGRDGVPTTKAIDEVASVANWATGGGAVATYTGASDELPEVTDKTENFRKICAGGEPEIPF